MTTAKAPRISLYAELPEELHDALTVYLDSHPNWTQNRVFCAALALFFDAEWPLRSQHQSHLPRLCLRLCCLGMGMQ